MSSEPLPIVFEQLPVNRRSLRVAVVTETYPPEVNGVSVTIARFVRGLRERNHEIQLVRPRQTRADQGGADEGYDEVLFAGMPIPRYPNLKMGLPAKRALLELWSARRPDLVHVVTEGPLGWSALKAAAKLRLPVCSDFRTNFDAYSKHYGVGWLKKPIAAYLRKFHNQTLLTMVPTEAIRRELAQRGFRNVRVVARGIDTRRFDPAHRSAMLRQAWGAGPQTPVAMYVGRLAPEKNLPTVVAAYEAMRARRPDTRLVLVGDGPSAAQIRARCPEAIFAGMRLGDDLAAHYASGDIFLFPSLTETFGNVTLEAMASGLAVTAFNCAAAGELLQHEVSGLLARVDDPSHFIDLAAGLVTDDARIRRLGERARAASLEMDWERIVGALESLYLLVADSGEGAVQRLAMRVGAGAQLSL